MARVGTYGREAGGAVDEDVDDLVVADAERAEGAIDDAVAVVVDAAAENVGEMAGAEVGEAVGEMADAEVVGETNGERGEAVVVACLQRPWKGLYWEEVGHNLVVQAVSSVEYPFVYPFVYPFACPFDSLVSHCIGARICTTVQKAGEVVVGDKQGCRSIPEPSIETETEKCKEQVRMSGSESSTWAAVGAGENEWAVSVSEVGTKTWNAGAASAVTGVFGRFRTELQRVWAGDSSSSRNWSQSPGAAVGNT